MKKYKKITIVAIIVLIAIPIIPIALNFILQIHIKGVPIIGGNNSEVVWLGFLGSYIGAIISSVIAFYILYIDRRDNFNTIQYKNEWSNMQSRIIDLIEYMKIYDVNRVKSVYNDWYLKRKDVEILRKEVKYLMANAFNAFELFSLKYSEAEFTNTPFLSIQVKNYSSLVYLLQELQILIEFEPKHWNMPTKFKHFLYAHKYLYIDLTSKEFLEALNKSNNSDSIFNILLDAHKDIEITVIESQVRKFIESEREALNLKFKDMQ